MIDFVKKLLSLENILFKKLVLNEWLSLNLSEWTKQRCNTEAMKKKVKKGSVGTYYLSVEKTYLSVLVGNQMKIKIPPLGIPKEGLNLIKAGEWSYNRAAAC